MWGDECVNQFDQGDHFPMCPNYENKLNYIYLCFIFVNYIPIKVKMRWMYIIDVK